MVNKPLAFHWKKKKRERFFLSQKVSVENNFLVRGAILCLLLLSAGILPGLNMNESYACCQSQ